MLTLAIVELERCHGPFSGNLYVFTNRARSKTKCIMWEDNGVVLYYKALGKERFKWPRPDVCLKGGWQTYATTFYKVERPLDGPTDGSDTATVGHVG
jgi:transposase